MGSHDQQGLDFFFRMVYNAFINLEECMNIAYSQDYACKGGNEQPCIPAVLPGFGLDIIGPEVYHAFINFIIKGSAVAYSNRRIKKMLGAEIVSTRRWCLIMLGEDPSAARNAGQRRLMSRSEAFKVYFGYYLNQNLRFSANEAKELTDRLWPIIESRGLLPKSMDGYDHSPVYLVIKWTDKVRGFRVKLKSLTKMHYNEPEKADEKTDVYNLTESYRVERFRPFMNLHYFGVRNFPSVSEIHMDLKELVHNFITAENSTKDMP
jgi:hypothetical protein